MLPDDQILFLDENLHRCKPILESLAQNGIRYECHGTHFRPGTPDQEWLPVVGRNRWLLLTADKNIRYNELERRAILRHNVRAFIFTSGNLNGKAMGELVVKAFPKIMGICRRHDAPFIASITQSGVVHLTFDKFGPTHRRRKRD